VISATHELVAEGTASTRESVSKIITELRAEGLIASGYRSITLVDREELARCPKASDPARRTCGAPPTPAGGAAAGGGALAPLSSGALEHHDRRRVVAGVRQRHVGPPPLRLHARARRGRRTPAAAPVFGALTTPTSRHASVSGQVFWNASLAAKRAASAGTGSAGPGGERGLLGGEAAPHEALGCARHARRTRSSSTRSMPTATITGPADRARRAPRRRPGRRGRRACGQAQEQAVADDAGHRVERRPRTRARRSRRQVAVDEEVPVVGHRPVRRRSQCAARLAPSARSRAAVRASRRRAPRPAPACARRAATRLPCRRSARTRAPRPRRSSRASARRRAP
jgi:hypothetical protein